MLRSAFMLSGISGARYMSAAAIKEGAERAERGG
jgi:hypothetical protein